jgi:hypothetical protein
MPIPTLELRAKLRDAILEHVATSDAARAFVKAMFASPEESRSVEEVIALMSESRSAESVRELKARLKERLEYFFGQHEVGRALPLRVTFENYRLNFVRNVVEPPEYLTRFWSHYFDSDHEVRIIYPEPEFFVDENPTYLRNPRALTSDVHDAFGYLRPKGKLEPSYSFVSSGVVRAMLLLAEMLQAGATRFITTPIRPFTFDADDDHDLIVLGTPTTSNLTLALEEPMIARTTALGIVVNGTLAYKDEQEEDVTGTKWALLTRREHRFQNRVVTSISAKHGRAVQAVAEVLLTRWDGLERLAAHLKANGSFPPYFQTVLRVEMSKAGGVPRIDAVTPEHTPWRNGMP